jgi:hypothetical protein
MICSKYECKHAHLEKLKLDLFDVVQRSAVLGVVVVAQQPEQEVGVSADVIKVLVIHARTGEWRTAE